MGKPVVDTTPEPDGSGVGVVERNDTKRRAIVMGVAVAAVVAVCGRIRRVARAREQAGRAGANRLLAGREDTEILSRHVGAAAQGRQDGRGRNPGEPGEGREDRGRVEAGHGREDADRRHVMHRGRPY